MVTVLTETSATEIAVEPGGPHPKLELWLGSADTAAITGWSMKPEGFCKGDICVPTPSGQADRFVQGNAVNVSAFWDLMGKPAVRFHAARSRWQVTFVDRLSREARLVDHLGFVVRVPA